MPTFSKQYFGRLGLAVFGEMVIIEEIQEGGAVHAHNEEFWGNFTNDRSTAAADSQRH